MCSSAWAAACTACMPDLRMVTDSSWLLAVELDDFNLDDMDLDDDQLLMDMPDTSFLDGTGAELL